MRKVYGVGVNDADYPVTTEVNGKRVTCKAYQRWANMLQRCYDPKLHARQTKYANCSVCLEWQSFMTFREWLLTNDDWESKELDKDLLVKGNTVYSPDTCVLVSRQVNTFTNERQASRGEYLIGVTIGRRGTGYRASIGKKYLGHYHCEKTAHAVWWTTKCDLAKKLASEQTDPRVANALRMYYTGMSPFCTKMSENDIDGIAC